MLIKHANLVDKNYKNILQGEHTKKKEEREGHTWASKLKCMRKWTLKKIIYLKTHSLQTAIYYTGEDLRFTVYTFLP